MRNAWKIDDLRHKILFTLVIILLYRLGNAVPVPYVNIDALSGYFSQMQNTVLGLLNVMSGGAFSNATIFALSIQPYINASIIIQLLCIAIPALERMSKEEGEEGKKKIASITRYATVAIGLLQGFDYYILIKNNGLLTTDGSGVWEAMRSKSSIESSSPDSRATASRCRTPLVEPPLMAMAAIEFSSPSWVMMSLGLCPRASTSMTMTPAS